jgi:NhaA family Na+:H+ antiporter
LTGSGHGAGRRPRPVRPLVEFLRTEAAGGIVLLGAAAVALVWANSPWQASYHDLWTTELPIGFGDHVLRLDLRDWVNDGLMAVFFLVVGLEIKRELVEGELREPRRAALPAIAAVGGMLVPALLYLALNAGGEGARGWGIPMATDIAMVVGAMSLLGSRVRPSMKVFLLALAIVDDVGAILVIAFVYSRSIDGAALALALGLLVLVVVMRVAGVRPVVAYVVVGVALWVALHESGVHATLVGVALGLLAPAGAAGGTRGESDASVAPVPASVVDRLEHRLHPWSSFVVLPLFALANAGIPLGADAVADAVVSPIAWGVVLGLVVGKPVGILAFSWLGHRLRIGVLPDGATGPALAGIAVLGGIGFTVSLFVTGLAFDRVVLQDEAKTGILAASVVAATVGTLVIRLGGPRRRTGAPR